MPLIPPPAKTPLTYCLVIGGFLLSIYLLFRLKDLLILLFIAFLFMTAVSPLVSYFERLKLSRTLSIVTTYFVVLVILGLVVGLIVPPFVNEVVVLINQIKLPPVLLHDLSLYNVQNLQLIASQLNSIPKILNALSTTFSSFVFFITFGVISFYLLLERPHLHQILVQFFGANLAEDKAEHFINTLEKQIGSWVRGQTMVMGLFGLLIFIGLALMQVPYALPLAILAAMFEMIPNIGGILSAAPAVIVAYLTMSPFMALAIIALYLLIQEVEHNVLVPMIMKRVIGVNPLITIILILTGVELGGIIGALLALPAYLVVTVFITEWRKLA